MMQAKRKYVFLTTSVLVVFVLILLTEIPGRWLSAFSLCIEFREKAAQLASPEQLHEKRLHLMHEKRSLVSQLGNEDMNSVHTTAGLYDFLNRTAQQVGLKLNSVIPEEKIGSANITEVQFEVSSHSRFHKIGRFVNAMESGPYSLRIRSLVMDAGNDKTGNVAMEIRAVVYLSVGR